MSGGTAFPASWLEEMFKDKQFINTYPVPLGSTEINQITTLL